MSKPTVPDHALFHVRLGWSAVALFAALGLVLEGMHGLKVGWYLETTSETRRLMFTLAHAHGALLGVVNLAYAALTAAGLGCARPAVASRCLAAGTVLMPSGFFLGGVFVYGGDPGMGVMLVPIGALALIVAAVACALTVGAPASVDEGETAAGSAAPPLKIRKKR